MREPAAPRYRWDLPPTRQILESDPARSRSRFGGLFSSPRIATASVALLAAVSVASVAMLVFNPFADPFDGPVAAAAPRTVTANAAATPATRAQSPAAESNGEATREAQASASAAASAAGSAVTARQPSATQARATPRAGDAAGKTAAPTASAEAAAQSADAAPLAHNDPRWGASGSGANPLVARKAEPADEDTTRTAFAGDRASARAEQKAAADTDEDQGDIGAAEPAASMVKAKIRGSVNMRSRGASGASVIGVVPAGTEVSMAPGCRHWCKIVYKGQTGYVYKSFVSR